MPSTTLPSELLILPSKDLRLHRESLIFLRETLTLTCEELLVKNDNSVPPEKVFNAPKFVSLTYISLIPKYFSNNPSNSSLELTLELLFLIPSVMISSLSVSVILPVLVAKDMKGFLLK